MRRTFAVSRRAAAVAGAAILSFGLAHSAPAAAQPAVTPERLENGAPYSFADLIEQVSPAVVSIDVTVEAAAGSPFSFGAPTEEIPEELMPFFRRFGIEPEDLQEPPEARAQGSGFFISPDGYIVTNNHVVANATSVTVTLKGGDELEAEIVGTDENTDLAVLKVSRDAPFPFVEFAEESAIRVGDWVVAVGNPFGLGGTATAGIVSATGREISNTVYNEFLQIDAPINRGNSGGPTFDLRGNVVGVNSQIFSPSGGSVGIGFAIPAPVASRIVDALIEDGRVVRGWLGVGIDPVDEDLAAVVGLGDPRGAIVNDVHAGGPAEAAGFREGDVILSVDGDEIENRVELVRRVGDLIVGERVRFEVFRDGRTRELVATIAERPSNEALLARNQGGGSSGGDFRSSSTLGMSLGELDDAAREQLGVQDGVLVQSVRRSSAAAEKGIGAGAVILRVGGEAVSDPADFVRLIDEAREEGQDAVLLLVHINGNAHYVALPLESEE